MIPYFLLLIIPALLFNTSVRILTNVGRTSLVVSRNQNSSTIPVFFFLFFLLLALRHESIGRDLANYKAFFQQYTQGGLSYVFSSWQECLFRLYNYVFVHITRNYQIYLAITALICVYPIYYIYRQDLGHGLLKVAVFVNMSTFIMIFSGLRQSMAMAIGMIAYQAVKEKKLLRFLLLTVIAFLIHHSGFMILLMYPAYHTRIKKAHLLAIVPLLCIMFVFNRQIFGVITSVLGNFSDKYNSTTTANGAFGSLILFALFTTFSFVVTDRKKCSNETLALQNFLLICVALQCFAPIHDTAMRMNYYFILFVPIALGKTLDYPKNGMQQVARVGEIVMCCFFSLYYLYNAYQSSITGISALDTYPYVPFWRG